MFFLQTFGGLALRSDSAPIPASAAQRRRLALLAILAAAGERGVTRDRLIGLLWPDSPSDSARHALEQLVYATRRDLGREALGAVGGMLRLEQTHVSSDIDEFQHAVAVGEWEKAATLYSGPFLDGVYLDGSGSWEQWVDSERERLAQSYSRVLEELARGREGVGDMVGAVDAWRRLAAHDCFSSRIALHLMRALEAAGDRAAAVRHADVHVSLLREELGLDPDPEITRLSDELRQARPAESPPSQNLLHFPLTTEASVDLPVSPSGGAPPAAAAPLFPLRRRVPTPVTAVAALALVVVVAGWFAGRGGTLPGAPSAGDPASVAVLPFVDMTEETDAEYFSDGMTEELIHALTQVEGLRVVARTSAFAFKAKDVDVREIGSALNVGAVLEGSVRRAGERVRVTVQLIDTRTGYHLWSESYDRQMADILAVQDEIAHAVVRRLRPEEEWYAPAPAVPAHIDAETYNLYLRGRFLWNKKTRESLLAAVKLYQSAIRRDSTFALAYMGLSDAYNSLNDNGHKDDETMLRSAEAAARTALRVDPSLAEAHTSLGHLHIHRWDWAGAEREFRQALEMKPGYATTYQYFAILQALQGRSLEAAALIRRAQELDPLSLSIHGTAGYIMYVARQYDEAERHLRTLIAMDSTRFGPHLRLGLVLIERGRFDEAIHAVQTALRLQGANELSSAPMLGYAYARAGRIEEAQRLWPVVEHGLQQGAIPKHTAAGYFGVLGEKDRAFTLLGQLVEERSSSLVDLGVSPFMQSLHSDPRFRLVIKKIGVPAMN